MKIDIKGLIFEIVSKSYLPDILWIEIFEMYLLKSVMVVGSKFNTFLLWSVYILLMKK